MRGAENLQMGPDKNMAEELSRLRESEIAAARKPKHQVILTLGVLLTVAFITVVNLMNFRFMNKSTEGEMSHLKNTDKSIKVAMSQLKNTDDGIKEELSDPIDNGSCEPLCSEGWIDYGLSCYNFSTNPQTWNDSKKDCEDQQAHLIVINDVGEMNFLREIENKTFWWIGLTDEDGTWKWVDGTPYDITPKFWGKGQPDDWTGHGTGGGEDCGVFRPTNDWNDLHCSAKLQYICEKKAIF